MMTLFWKRRAAMISKDGAHGEERQGVDPQMLDSGAAQDDAASDIDEIAGGHEVAEDAEEQRHGFAREDITGKKNAGEDGDESELHGFALRAGFAGDEDSERQAKQICRAGREMRAATRCRGWAPER